MSMAYRLRAALAAALILALLALAAPAGARAEAALDEDKLYGEALLLMDADTGEVLYSHNSKVRMYPASTTKIMTLMLALESGIDLNKTVTVPKAAGDIPSGSSTIPVRPGDKLTFRDLLYGFMLNSGNDGANAIAVLVDGSISKFVEHMNARAQKLGCEDTHFKNAHGYHNSEHYTTARDLATMTRAAMKNATFRKIVAAPDWKVTIRRGKKTGTRDIPSRVLMVRSEEKFYYEYCTGVKTGFHKRAGYCFVGTASKDGVNLLCVTLNCPEEDQKWYDAARLFEYGFSRYEPVTYRTLLNRAADSFSAVTIDNAAEDDPSAGALTLRLDNVSGGDATRMVISGSEDSMDRAVKAVRKGAKVTWTRSLEAPVQAGEVLGTVSYTGDDGSAVTADLTAPRDVDVKVEVTPTPAPPPRQAGMVTPARSRSDLPSWLPMALLALAGLLVAVAVGLILSGQRRERRRSEAERRRRQAARRRKAASASGQTGKKR